MASGGTISIRKEGEVASVLLARPPLNILSFAMMEEISSHLDELAGDADVGAVVIESDLRDVFSAGADVREHLPATADRLIRTLDRLVLTLLTFPRPTVSIVRGKCLGGGMELAMACDFVLAGDQATFGQPEASVGVFPPVAAALYPRLVGLRRAYEVLLTGRTLTAAQALSMGFVTSVHPDDQLGSARTDLLRALTSKSRIVLQHAKRALLEGLSLPLEQALHVSSDIYLKELMGAEDAPEGLNAFLEKRKPIWKHK
jgi:cyclohexa-1,5-dienecarbonyl-CoA hydratase